MKAGNFNLQVAAIIWGLAAIFTVCAMPANAAVSSPIQKQSEFGTASFYGAKYQGKPTASGEIFDLHKLTAAHPTLAFGTVVRVTNLENNRSVIVRINDRGPFIGGRAIDLSQAAAEELQMVRSGLAKVKIEVLH